ncbi:MAG: acyltransferase family protein [Pseudomonadota bacterium]|nr:acyltransferase family protein [Pseudomonadota bacterium]
MKITTVHYTPAINQNENSAQRTRVAWIDVARGFCIILVVIGHTIDGIRSAGLIPGNGILLNVFYYIYTFHMAAFFVLSGLLARPSVNRNPTRFFYNIIKHIVYPYFLYGIIQLSIMNMLGSALNHPIPFDPFEYFSLIYGTVSPLWFLKTLFSIHIAYLISKQYCNGHCLLLICIVLRGCVELFLLPTEISQFCTFGIFYALGVVFSEEAIEWPSGCRFPLIWVGIFGLLWVLFSTASLNEIDPILAGARLRGSLLPASIVGSLFVFALSGVRYVENNKLLLYIGQRTLPIFLLHVMFVAGTRILLAKVLGITVVAVIVPAAILAGVLGPLAIVEIAERFRLRSTLGLG